MSGPYRQVRLGMGEVHDLSLLILELLEGEEVNSDLAFASVALTLARLTSPLSPLSIEKEIELTENLMQFVQMDTAKGVVN